MALEMFAITMPVSAVGDIQTIVDKNDDNSVENNNQHYLHEDDPIDVSSELAYWVRFEHLQGWMEKLFVDKGGSMENDFNRDFVRLIPEDLDRLWKDAQLDNFKFMFPEGVVKLDVEEQKSFCESTGVTATGTESDRSVFWYSNTVLYKSDMLKLIDFINRARSVIKNDDLAVFYYSWW